MKSFFLFNSTQRTFRIVRHGNVAAFAVEQTVQHFAVEHQSNSAARAQSHVGAGANRIAVRRRLLLQFTKHVNKNTFY